MAVKICWSLRTLHRLRKDPWLSVMSSSKLGNNSSPCTGSVASITMTHNLRIYYFTSASPCAYLSKVKMWARDLSAHDDLLKICPQHWLAHTQNSGCPLEGSPLDRGLYGTGSNQPIPENVFHFRSLFNAFWLLRKVTMHKSKRQQVK